MGMHKMIVGYELFSDKVVPYNLNEPISLSLFSNPETPAQIKETNMCYSNPQAYLPPAQFNIEANLSAKDVDADKRQYLERRVYTIYNDQDGKLRETFHMDQDEVPEGFTVADVIARLKAGTFIVDEDNLKRNAYNFEDALSYIQWRDPAVPADETGYSDAMKRAYDARQNTIDDVKILFIEDALQSVRDFEKMDFSTKAQ